MANCYASVALPLLPVDDTAPPLHVIEVGAGHGKFSFCFLHRLKTLYDRLTHGDAPSTKRKWPPVLYVMTDFCDSNVQVWKQHPCLMPLVDAGVLDFAILDAEAPFDSVTLSVSGRVLRPGCLQSVMVVANYFIDTLPSSAYRVTRQGVLEHAHVRTTVRPPFRPLAADDTPAPESCAVEATQRLQQQHPSKPLLDHTRTRFVWRQADRGAAPPSTARTTSLPPAGGLADPSAWRRVVHNTASTIRAARTQRCFVMPCTALECMERLRQLVAPGGAFVTVVSDKGYLSLPALVADDDASRLYIAQHGSVSFTVFFPAVEQLFSMLPGGFSCTPAPPQPHYSSINTCAFGTAPRAVCAAVQAAYNHAAATFSPDSFYAVMDRFDAVTSRAWQLRFPVPGRHPPSCMALDVSLALLRLGVYDPGVFLALCSGMQRQAPTASRDLQEALSDAVRKVADVRAGAVCVCVCLSCLLCSCRVVTHMHPAVRAVPPPFRPQLAYMVTPYDASDVLVECARLQFRLGNPQHALELTESSLARRAALTRVFNRAPSSAATVSVALRIGSSQAQAAALFVKSLCAQALGNDSEAAEALHSAAAISRRRYGRFLTASFVASSTPAARSDSDAALQARQAYFRKRLQQAQAQAGVAAAEAEIKLLTKELDRLTAKRRALNDE